MHTLKMPRSVGQNTSQVLEDELKHTNWISIEGIFIYDYRVYL